jgi:hypothetical protein
VENKQERYRWLRARLKRQPSLLTFEGRTIQGRLRLGSAAVRAGAATCRDDCGLGKIARSSIRLLLDSLESFRCLQRSLVILHSQLAFGAVRSDLLNCLRINTLQSLCMDESISSQLRLDLDF